MSPSSHSQSLQCVGLAPLRRRPAAVPRPRIQIHADAWCYSRVWASWGHERNAPRPTNDKQLPTLGLPCTLLQRAHVFRGLGGAGASAVPAFLFVFVSRICFPQPPGGLPSEQASARYRMGSWSVGMGIWLDRGGDQFVNRNKSDATICSRRCLPISTACWVPSRPVRALGWRCRLVSLCRACFPLQQMSVACSRRPNRLW